LDSSNREDSKYTSSTTGRFNGVINGGGGAMPPIQAPTGAEPNTFIIKKFWNKDVTPRGSCYLLLVLAVQRSIKLGFCALRLVLCPGQSVQKETKSVS